MNNRLKFRVWNKKEDCYIVPPNPQPLLQANGLLAYFTEDTAKAMDFYDIEFCTGLKDKNGKLVYEGDVVREISKKEPEWEEYITEVKWKKCGFNLYSDEDYDFEIIGNIHQNQELLKEEK